MPQGPPLIHLFQASNIADPSALGDYAAEKRSRRSACTLFQQAPRLVPMLAITLFVAGCVVTKSARVVPTAEPWSHDGFAGRRFTSEHFDIFSTLRDTEFESAIPDFVEAAYKQYETTLPTSTDARAKLTMYIFAARSEWMRFTRRRFPARAPIYAKIRSGGYTEGTVSVLFYVNRSSTLATIAHEGWHQYVGAFFEGLLPAWLNEGLACCHEAVEYAGPKPKFTPRHNTFRINNLREAIQQDTLMSLSELVNTHAGDVISQDHTRITQGYYAQTWALITFLRHGAGGRYASALSTLLRDITEGRYAARVGASRLITNNGRSLSPGEAVFRAYFDCAPDALADQYYDHLIRIAGY